MSEPIVYTDAWRAVMKVAGFRCQCSGQCGSDHKKGEGRCLREHDTYASKRRAPTRLLVAPADPATPVMAAARLSRAELRAWCPDCHDGARRAANRQARTQPDDSQNALFEL